MCYLFPAIVVHCPLSLSRSCHCLHSYTLSDVVYHVLDSNNSPDDLTTNRPSLKLLGSLSARRSVRGCLVSVCAATLQPMCKDADVRQEQPSWRNVRVADASSSVQEISVLESSKLGEACEVVEVSLSRAPLRCPITSLKMVQPVRRCAAPVLCLGNCGALCCVSCAHRGQRILLLHLRPPPNSSLSLAQWVVGLVSQA